MKKRIILLESFYSGSHKRWAKEFQEHSSHHVEIFSLPGRHWKWRMHGAAISFAEKIAELNYQPDYFLLTDMTDLSVFRSLTQSQFPKTKYALYFHENQITYPWSDKDEDVKLQRNNHYGFINYHSALSADKVFFNSNYHQQFFITSLSKFLLQFPDHQNLESIDRIQKKSAVLPIGINFQHLQSYVRSPSSSIPVLVWNHRWEYDKNPQWFFDSIRKLKEEGLDFSLIVLGEKTQKYPAIFDDAVKLFADNILHFGYCENKDEYYKLLAKADFLPVCSHQDFFGYSIVEAIALGIHPILPNRLAYPEHINIENKPSVFYESDEDFYVKLKESLNQERLDIRTDVAKYDWSELIDLYDHEFNS